MIFKALCFEFAESREFIASLSIYVYYLQFSRLLSNEMIRWSLLLLRNLSLDRSRKPVFLSHEAWMEFIINQCTSACEDNVVEAAYSALWCLLYQSQKAVSILKKNHRLDEILTRANQTGITKAHRAVQILIQK